MAKRAGLSISVKMILTTTFLILLTVVGFGVLNACNIRSAYDQASREKIDTFRQSLNTKGATTTQVFAKALEKFLIDNQDTEIQQLVEKTVRQDEGLKIVYVLGRDQNLIAYCKVTRGNATVCDAGGDPGRGQFKEGLPNLRGGRTRVEATQQRFQVLQRVHGGGP